MTNPEDESRDAAELARIDEILNEWATTRPNTIHPASGFEPDTGEAKHRQQVRVLVTSGLLGMIALVIVGIFALLFVGRFQDAKDVAQMLFTPLLTAAAPIFGFYFAQRN